MSKVGHFLVCDRNERKVLVEVLKDHDTEYEVIYENKWRYTDKRTIETVMRAEVVLDLGKKPPYGNVYGNQVEPLWREVKHEDFGSVRIFYPISKDDWAILEKCLTRTARWMAELGVESLLPLDIEIRHPKGKMAGHYHYFSDGQDVMTIRLPVEQYKVKANIMHVLYHEIGHGIMFRIMPEQYKARWLKLYHRYTKRNRVELEQLTKIWRGFLKSDETIRGYRMSLNEESSEHEAMCFDLILDYIQDKHYLSARDLQLLIDNGEDVTTFGPTVGLIHTDMEEPLGEYANKSVDEFFCEALRLHAQGKVIPETIQKALVKTLDACRVAAKSED